MPVTRVAQVDATMAEAMAALGYGWNATAGAFQKLDVNNSDGGLTVHVANTLTTSGSTAATIADGADVAQGAKADSAWVSGDGSVVAILKGIFGRLRGGQAAMASSLPVAISSDQSAVPVSGTFFQATQPVSATSLPLPSGASTAAKQPALGTAGTASADVLSVQGVASMAALIVDSELAAAVASGDAMAKPTTAPVISHMAGYNGATEDLIRAQNVLKIISGVAYTAGTAQTIWTPTAGKKWRLMGYALSNSVSGAFKFIDGAGGSEKLRTPSCTGTTPNVSPGTFGNGLISTTADNVLQLDVTASGTVHGYVFGVEE